MTTSQKFRNRLASEGYTYALGYFHGRSAGAPNTSEFKLADEFAAAIREGRTDATVSLREQLDKFLS